MLISAFVASNIYLIRSSINHTIFKNTLQTYSLQRYSTVQFFKNNLRSFTTSRLLVPRLKQSQCFVITRLKQTSQKSQPARNFETNVVSFKTNVINNVILYKYEKNVMFNTLKIFGLVQFISLWIVAYNLYSIYRWDLSKEYNSWWEKIINSFVPIGLITVLFIAAPLITSVLWFISTRTVKYLILNRGGSKVTFITYHPIPSMNKLTVPVEKIHCNTSRMESKGYISLKIKETRWRYIVDRSGEFPNPKLFDTTVGVERI